MMMPFICSCRNKKYIVYLVPVFCHTHVGLETFYEGEGDEMLPGCRVVHVLAARSYSLSPITSPLWRSIAGESLSSARHSIEAGGESDKRGRGSFAVTCGNLSRRISRRRADAA